MFAWSINDEKERNRADELGWDFTVDPEEVRIRVVYHRKCLEKILTNPRGPYDPEVLASMYDEYRGQLLERFEELKPGQVRFPSKEEISSEEVPALPND